MDGFPVNGGLDVGGRLTTSPSLCPARKRGFNAFLAQAGRDHLVPLALRQAGIGTLIAVVLTLVIQAKR